jgi:hypothetical protein
MTADPLRRLTLGSTYMEVSLEHETALVDKLNVTGNIQQFRELAASEAWFWFSHITVHCLQPHNVK